VELLQGLDQGREGGAPYRVDDLFRCKIIFQMIEFLEERLHGEAKDRLLDVLADLKEGFHPFMAVAVFLQQDIFQIEQIYFLFFSFDVEFAELGVFLVELGELARALELAPFEVVLVLRLQDVDGSGDE